MKSLHDHPCLKKPYPSGALSNKFFFSMGTRLIEILGFFFDIDRDLEPQKWTSFEGFIFWQPFLADFLMASLGIFFFKNCSLIKGGGSLGFLYFQKCVILASENDLFGEKRYSTLFDTLRTHRLSPYNILDHWYSQPCPWALQVQKWWRNN